MSTEGKHIDEATHEVCSVPNSLEYPIKPRSKLFHYARSFRLTRQLRLAWTSAVLTTIFLIMTAVYASQATIAARMRLLYTSSSNTIFVLSALSGLTSVFLASTIAAAFERLQWLLVSRKDGLEFTKFLGLQSGTGVAGLIALTVGSGHPLMTSTRLWSAGRLLTIVLVPALGVLIMSNVNTQLTFEGVSQKELSLGWGMTPFNVSLAKNISVIIDQLSQAQLSQFLVDPSRAIDLTPSSLRSKPCTLGVNSLTAQNCQRSFFVPGGVEFAAPEVQENRASSDMDIFLVRNQQGYMLDFDEGDSTWREKNPADCQVYGFPFAAFYLCLRDSGYNILDAHLVQCPNSIAARSKCRSDTSWHSNPGWATRLTATFRRANVAYSMSNATILSHTFSDSPPVPAPMNATEMLQAYRDAFGDFEDLPDVLKVLADPEGTEVFPMYTYPAVVWWCLKGVSSLGAQNPAMVTRAADTLYCLLAMVLYYCQPGLYARALMKPALNRTALDPDIQKFAADLLAIAPPDTQVYLSGLRYQIVVGRARLVAYVVLCGVTLGLCLCVLVFGSYAPVASHVPETSPFPSWDSLVNCEVKHGSGAAVDHRAYSASSLKGETLVRAAADMRIRLLDDVV